MDSLKHGIRNVVNRLDYTLLLCVFLLFIISLISIYSASGQYSQDPSYYLILQAIWFGLGFIAIIFVVLFIEYEHYRSLAIPLYVIGLLSLIYVHFFGEMRKGSQRWVSIGGIDIQPSEFVKIFLIIMLATAIYKITERSKNLMQRDVSILTSVAVLSLIPFYFIFSQPDLGTSLVIVAIAGTMLFMSGVSAKLISFIVLGIGVILAALAWVFVNFPDIFNLLLKDHQLERIYGWLQPDQFANTFGYQLSGARMGIGSGQLFGSGFQEGAMSQSGRVPEIHTDFIFTVIGEEFGFFGVSILLLIFFIMIYRMVLIAINSKDLFGMCLIAGVIGLFTFQIFQNIGMTIGLMPITGLTLPFISYGGSSLLTNMIAVGIVMNVHVHTKEYMFEN
ncbi:rod shape-determining protein RodA [Virgibacillus natechei]|uniref:Rod shape-determining protein RodA n=1 Tax=Virgibacillus natechei TaxID=1216297 RepID=A0ABS4IML1_9BACI|nr:rod shape-determining protein RodA [Virgibacillus natechei]MBP1971541.1 rod shape-determining protein RodA [Virgibacillus natechei]UZD11989.1 rod shape-determining protein RodA [Virgibacillus natechei]